MHGGCVIPKAWWARVWRCHAVNVAAASMHALSVACIVRRPGGQQLRRARPSPRTASNSTARTVPYPSTEIVRRPGDAENALRLLHHQLRLLRVPEAAAGKCTTASEQGVFGVCAAAPAAPPAALGGAA